MTPEERAENICDEMSCDACNAGLSNAERARYAPLIAAQIRDAVEEAKDRWSHVAGSIHICEEGMIRAKAEAYEDAAKIAHDIWQSFADASLLGHALGAGKVAGALRARAKSLGD